MGDSVVCFREGTVVKVHVHTRKPGDVFNYMQQFGEFLTMKIENMTLQHNEVHGGASFKSKIEKPRKPYGIVSVAAGKESRTRSASWAATWWSTAVRA